MRSIRSLFLVALAALAAAPSQASWGPAPVVVHPSASVQLLDSAPDGEYGAYFLWQDGAPGTAGVLRLQHLLATGDLDPSWPPSGKSVCGVLAVRGHVGLVPDGEGATYAWWTEGTDLYARHMLASFEDDPSWPTRGLLLAAGAREYSVPCVVADGTGGIYACWVGSAWQVMLSHYGMLGAPIAGWNPAGRLVSNAWLRSTSPSMSALDDGGVLVAWAGYSSDTSQAASGFYARSIRSNGTAVPGWGAPFSPTLDAVVPSPYAVARIAADAEGGAVVLTGEPHFQYAPLYRLHRRLADGTTSPGWDESGLFESGGELAFSPNMQKPTLLCTRDGRIVIGASGSFSIDGPMNETVTYTVGLDGQCVDCGMYPIGPYGNVSEFQPDPSRGFHQIVSNPCWYPNHWDPIPFTSYVLVRSRGSFPGGMDSWYVLDGGWPAPASCSFDPVTLSPTGDGGAIAGWVATYGVEGLVAVRLGAGGAVTSVPGIVRHSRPMAACFVPGQGLRATLEGASRERGRLECFDVGGRLVAAAELPAGSSAVTLSGTRSLPSGLYLLRLRTGTRRDFAKVVVTR